MNSSTLYELFVKINNQVDEGLAGKCAKAVGSA